jgi:hypothetical protein
MDILCRNSGMQKNFMCFQEYGLPIVRGKGSPTVSRKNENERHPNN